MIKFEDCKNVRLSPGYQIKPFDCGDNDLNEFLLEEAHDYLTELYAVTYLFEFGNDTVAFFSVSNDRISYDEDTISKPEWNRFCRPIPYAKRRKDNPAVKIGRFGVNRKYQNSNIGTDLMMYIKFLFINKNKTGCRFITVDAYKKPEVINFYKKNGFVVLSELNKDDEKDKTRLMYFDLKRFQLSAAI